MNYQILFNEIFEVLVSEIDRLMYLGAFIN